MAAEDALKAVMYSGELQQRVSENMLATIDGAFKSINEGNKAAADIYQGMVNSAHNFRQQEIDTYFQTKNLALREKGLDVDVRFKELGHNLAVEQLDFQKEKLDEEISVKRAEAEARIEATKNKADASDWFRTSAALDQETNQFNRQLEEQKKVVESIGSKIADIKSVINDPAKRAEYLERKEQIDAELQFSLEEHALEIASFEELKTKRDNTFIESQKANRNRIGVENGYMKLSPEDARAGRHALPTDQPDDAPDSDLLPVIGPRNNRNTVISKSTAGKKGLEVSGPSVVPAGKYGIDEILQHLADPRIPADQARRIVAMGNPDAQQKIEEQKKLVEQQTLLNYAELKLDPKNDLKKENLKELASRYERFGGSVGTLGAMQLEVDKKYSELYIENFGANSDEEMNNNIRKGISTFLKEKTAEKVESAKPMLNADATLTPEIQAKVNELTVKGKEALTVESLDKIEPNDLRLRDAGERQKIVEESKKRSSNYSTFENKYVAKGGGINSAFLDWVSDNRSHPEVRKLLNKESKPAAIWDGSVVLIPPNKDEESRNEANLIKKIVSSFIRKPDLAFELFNAVNK